MPDIAIIGLSFQFPGANSPDSYWELMLSGKCKASDFPPHRISKAKYHESDETRKGTISPSKACFLDRDITAFDARMFGITSEEAVGTDPQQRVLLEVTYRALENAGIPLHKISGSDTCVYTGCFSADYMLCCGKDPENQPKYAATGVAASMLSNRISTFFNLTGPSITVDTACSSSLVALDLACRSISQGESSMGIVAGCNVLLSPDYFIGLSALGFLSPDGMCHSFDGRANGYGRGEGFGVLIVKSVQDAIRDGDTIRAIIRATGTNQNGRTTLAQPSKELQMQLIKDVYHKAQLNPLHTRFFEAHGTGTAIGDPLEAMAIGDSFRAGRDIQDPLIIGAVKANIGHLEGCAGIAGVIKAILVLERGIIPPIAELQEVNPAIDAEFLRLQFPKKAIPWPSTGLRRASVNSFGFGGTNAHVVLDDAYHYLQMRGLFANHCTAAESPRNRQDTQNAASASLDPSEQDDQPLIFVWSGHEDNTVSDMMSLYQEYLSNTLDKSISLHALAYTLSEKRTSFNWRSFAVASSKSELVDDLQSPRPAIQSRSYQRLAFVFTGQGAQWLGMGQELMMYPVFRASVLEAESYLMTLECDWKVTDALYKDTGSFDTIHQPRFAQPLTTIIQIALVSLLRSFKIVPATVVGHSSGEIAAAFTMGAIDKFSAWRLAYYRGMLSSQLTNTDCKKSGLRGAMMAVGLSESAVLPYIEKILKDQEQGKLTVGCVNSPQNCTLSGDETLVYATQSLLQRDGVFTRVLRVPVAYHSPHMSQCAESYQELIQGIQPGKSMWPHTTMVSSVTGDIIMDKELQQPEYWVKNLVSTVRFADAIGRICRDSEKEVNKKLDLSHLNHVSVTDFVEIGPHSTLQGPIQQILSTGSSHGGDQPASYNSTLIRGQNAMSTILEMIGNLHCLGIDIDLSRVNRNSIVSSRLTATLPTLPEYPFNHSTSYWSEPRISRQTRLDPNPYNGLLGLPVNDWNPLQPRWRNTIRASSIPWVEDHKINKDILYPAAGMCVMAIEAMAHISQDQRILAYEIRDCEIFSALIIPPDEIGVEVEFSLKLSPDTSRKTSSPATFSLVACRNDTFVEICTGIIKCQTEHAVRSELDENREQRFSLFSDLVDSADFTSSSELKPRELYDRLNGYGYCYGPSFQGIKRARTNKRGVVIGNVSLERPPATPTSRIPAAVHPATLDNMWQLMIPSIAIDDIGKWKTWVPTHISKMWVSASGFESSTTAGHAQVFASTTQKSARLCESDVYAVDEVRGTRLLHTEGVESMVVVTDDLPADHNSAKAFPRRLCYNLIPKPDITMLGNEETMTYINGSPSAPDPTELLRLIKLYILASLTRIARQVSEADVPPKPPHLRKQLGWIKSQLRSAKEQTPPGLPANWTDYADDWEFQKMSLSLARTGRLGEIYIQFGNQIPDVLRGTKDALEILSEGHTLRDYYDEFNRNSHFFAPLSRYLDAMAHKNPGMKILEVGAGTGSATKKILDVLSTDSTNGTFCRFSHYDMTDISPSFVNNATQQFGRIPKLGFHVFDAEHDPVAQGYELHTYDLVIAVNVLHATKSLGFTLKNLRGLLKDSGKLILIEITETTSNFAHFIFGLLPGWWHGQESWRQCGPCVSTSQWDELLRTSGFSGADMVLEDSTMEENRFQSLIISSAAKESATSSLANEGIQGMIGLLITGWSESHESSLSISAASSLRALGVTDIHHSTIRAAAAENDLSTKLVVFIQQRSWLSLTDMDASQYNLFNETVKASRHIMWISDLSTTALSSLGLISGFARTIRKEMYHLVFATVGIQAARENLLPSLMEKSAQNFIAGVSTDAYEPELVQIGDSLHISRLYEDYRRNQDIFRLTSNQVEKRLRFGERKLMLQIGQPGLLDTLLLTESPDTESPLAPDEIVVEVNAIGVNFRDCLIALGRIDQNVFGSECAGLVIQTGENCKHSIGDRVIVSTLGTFRGQVRCQDKLATKVPSDMGFPQAAGLATIFITAYHSLIRLARLSRGETILIHSGAGGTGQAAIQLAKLCGAEVFTTVGSMAKKSLLNRLYDIPDDHILNSRDLSFADDIKRLTHNRGVDVVLNSLAGDALVASWECVAPYGRFIEIGKRDIISHGKLPMYQFARNVSFSAVDVGLMTHEKPELIQEALDFTMKLFADHKLSAPSPLKTFPVTQIEAAFRYLQGGNNSGKVVVEVDRDEMVIASVKPRPEWKFSPYDTFLIAGGLGAQGKKIARWMVTRGARNLALISRSAERVKESSSFLEELRETGATVHCAQCDIADASSLEVVMEYCRVYMPPIKGCIHAAMDLRDGVFENMSYDMWRAALRPKFQGSWNLHSQLPRGLDFFILFSSIAGVIGSQGQSNYAAGNTYQDMLAQYRVTHGEKAISINFGLLEGEGWATEHRDAKLQFMNTKHIMIMSEAEVFAVLDHYCNKDLDLDPTRWQLVLGLELQADIIKRGLEPAAWMNEPMFGNLLQMGATESGNSDDTQKEETGNDAALLAQVKATAPVTEAAVIVAMGLARKLTKILSLKEGSLDVNRPLHVYGVDSLLAVELRNWIQRTTKVDIAAFEILGGGTAMTLGRAVVDKIRFS
ncbi:putative polyketide synthase [Hypoxylon cercidicola]|nr:putative polyketide synthase [Hypoxylon cercidicola]